ncbi:MAG TPA: response regulator [Terracidiphilus sp.]|nr:response regulator [Terracidiphilus sp.]
MTALIKPVPGPAETVHIVDDDPSICEGLSNLLEAAAIRTECYPSAETFRKVLSGALSGCILLDARLPGISGPDFQDELLHIGCAVPVVFMTAHGDMPMVRKVLKSGAVEFLFKPFQKEELLQAVRHAFAIDRERREEEAIVRSIRERVAALTERERQIMAMVTSGLLNKQIAGELGISEIMVKVHRRRVMERMRAESLADLVKMCERVKAP